MKSPGYVFEKGVKKKKSSGNKNTSFDILEVFK